MTDFTNIIAIIVAEGEHSSIFYASVKYQYDMKIIEHPSKRLQIGSWIMVKVPRVFAAPHTVPLQHEPNDYTIIPQIYNTTVDSKIVGIEFQYFLGEQAEIDNDLIGPVKRSNNISLKNGKWTIRVENFLDPFEPFRKTQWLLKELTECIPPEFATFGIVCGTTKANARLKYVWCNRRAVGEDVLLQTRDGDVLPNGTWIQMTWRSERDFRVNEQPLGYSRVEPVYKTTGSASTIGMILEGRVEASEDVKDLYHPFVGLILNTQFTTPFTGIYKLDIVRGRKNTGNDGVTESVWYLKKATPIGKNAISKPPTPVQDRLKIDAFESPPSYEKALNLPSANLENSQRAVITGIQYTNSDATKFFIWNFDEKKAGLLIVPISQSEQFKMGTFFTATDFKENQLHPGNLNSNGENLRVIEAIYETRIERKPNVKILQFKVSVGNFQRKDGDVTVEHEDFGVIVDNMDRLDDGASRSEMKLQMWIKRMNLRGRQCWVVVEAL